MRQLATYFLLLLLMQSTAQAQRINFKPYVQDETIDLVVVENPLGLNFNNKQGIIVTNDPNPVTVEITDFATVVIEIDAPLDYDLTLEFTLPTYMSLGGADTGVFVPLQINYAYNNTGESSDAARRATAVQVPTLFNVVTLPVRRRQAGGPPGPPPTPDHAGYTRPRGKVYVYIYGTLGTAPANASAGNYAAEIQLNVNYADNSF